MTYATRLARATPQQDAHPLDGELDDPHVALTQYLGLHQLALVHSQGRMEVLVSGTVMAGEREVAYRLLADDSRLSKVGLWRRLSPRARLDYIRERLSPEVAAAAHKAVADEVNKFVDAVQAAGMAPAEVDAIWAALQAPEAFLRDRVALMNARLAKREGQKSRLELADKAAAAVDLARYPESFREAQQMRRKFIAVLGPTNSGKTHAAMEHLAMAKSGAYLAPLRLLALENYERLRSREVAVSLVTGEEQRINPHASHVASTIEMANFTRRVEVAIIDEVHLIADPDRGGAWVAAICGIPAETVYLLGPTTALPAIKALANRLGVPLEVRELERKSPLHIMDEPLTMKDLRPGDALIVFSRREALEWAETVSRAGYPVATIYGNLSPETRQAQADRFRSGEAQVIVGTDAIGMGLNLPIARILFTTAIKYDGNDESLIDTALALQIAGRAGRFGLHEEGYVSAMGHATLRALKATLAKQVAPLPSAGFQVLPSMDILQSISAATKETRLARLLGLFKQHTDMNDPFFVPASMEEQLVRARWLDTLALTLEQKFLFSLVPISTRSSSQEQAWQAWATNVAAGKPTKLEISILRPGRFALQEAEDACKRYSAYAWLGYRMPDMFPHAEQAVQAARTASDKVNELLLAKTKATGRIQGAIH